MMKSNSNQIPYNLNEIKRRAKQSIDRGAITEDYPLDLKLACMHLNAALATEIMCVLRYRHHQVIATGIDSPQVAAEFAEHATEEQQHMMMIAERINQLGGNPDFNPGTVLERTATEYGKGADLLQLIEEDLVAERVAIMVYRELIQWFGSSDPTTRRLLEAILEDEEEHADDLSELLKSRTNA